MKNLLIAVVAVGIFVASIAGTNVSENPKSLPANETLNQSALSDEALKNEPEANLVCNGTTITANCELNGTEYIKYLYHPAVAEVSHTETVTTYEKEASGYCTLCNDGTYSPSCATGRGACSWHGGVAQWNAPRYITVPRHIQKKVVDSPAKEEYYEKIPR